MQKLAIRLRLRIKSAALFLFSAVALLSGCAEGKPEELRRLESMGLEQARSAFQKLPPHTQVSIVVWELEHRRPSSSRFDYLLDRNGLKVGPVLLAEAARTKSFDVNITLLLEFAELGRLQVVDDDDQLAAAIARCYELGGKATVNAGKFVRNWHLGCPGKINDRAWRDACNRMILACCVDCSADLLPCFLVTVRWLRS